jgi:ATP-dependent Clp protease, protease subunit
MTQHTEQHLPRFCAPQHAEDLEPKEASQRDYVHHTGQPRMKIEDALERDYFLTAEMARDFGLIDKVIDKRPVPAEKA